MVHPLYLLWRSRIDLCDENPPRKDSTILLARPSAARHADFSSLVATALPNAGTACEAGRFSSSKKLRTTVALRFDSTPYNRPHWAVKESQHLLYEVNYASDADLPRGLYRRDPQWCAHDYRRGDFNYCLHWQLSTRTRERTVHDQQLRRLRTHVRRHLSRQHD